MIANESIMGFLQIFQFHRADHNRPPGLIYPLSLSPSDTNTASIITSIDEPIKKKRLEDSFLIVKDNNINQVKSLNSMSVGARMCRRSNAPWNLPDRVQVILSQTKLPNRFETELSVVQYNSYHVCLPIACCHASWKRLRSGIEPTQPIKQKPKTRTTQWF